MRTVVKSKTVNKVFRHSLQLPTFSFHIYPQFHKPLPFSADHSFTVAEPLPVIYTVGEPAFLSCIGKTETKPNQSVVWSRAEGELPSGSHVQQGVLVLPSVHRNDEGSYTCEIVKEEDPVISTVDLQVEDFVPVISGEPIELPPLSDEELVNFDIEITLNSSNPKGIIFETKRINTGDLLAQPFDTIHHEARITDHGTILYEFDIGYGKQIVETTNPMNTNEWNVVRIRNDKNEVKVQLNDEPATIRTHTNPLPRLSTGVNKPVYIGGRYEPTSEEDDFNGVISQVILSGENVGLGDARIPASVVKYDACASSNLCLNGAKCRNSNNYHGFTCECNPKFHGEFCQWRSSSCHDENCNSGICLDNEESWQCVCPLGTGGLRCEEKVKVPQPLGFTSDTSFLAVKKPMKFESIKMKLRPQADSDEHILMYFASEYGSGAKQYTSLSLIDNQVVLTVNRPNKEAEKIMSEPLERGQMIDVAVAQTDNVLVMTVNGNQVSTIESDSLKPGTEIFIGGLPPGLNSPDDVVERSFQGCVYEIFINSQDVDLQNLASSGDISSCDEPLSPTEIEQEETTEEPTEEPTEETTTTTEEPEETTTEEPTTEEPTTTTEEPTTTTTTTEPPTTTEEVYHFYEINKDSDPEIIIPVETTTTTTEATTTTTSASGIILPTDPEPIDENDVSDEEEELSSVTTVIPDEEPEPTSEEEDDYSEGTLPPDSEEEEECLDGECPLPSPESPEISICANSTCGMNGQCVPRNKTHYTCECKLYYDGPTCSLFKPIEHAARFDGDAFIELSSDEFPHLTSEKDEIVAFKFKTEQANGVLLWQGQRPTVTQMEDYISVGIVNGHLHFSYELGGGAAHLISEDRVDDGKEHSVRFERKGREGQMKVDNHREVNGRSTGILAMLNVDGNIFVGGVPEIYKATGGLFSKNFVGCIADVELNGVKLDLMATAIDGKNVKPCDEWMHRKRWLYRRRVR